MGKTGLGHVSGQDVHAVYPHKHHTACREHWAYLVQNILHLFSSGEQQEGGRGVREEWVEQEKGVSYLVCVDSFSEDACGAEHAGKAITHYTQKTEQLHATSFVSRMAMAASG